MNWISVKERLPEIPEGKYGISVIVAAFDSIYEELCPGKGYSVHTVLFSLYAGRDGTIKKNFKGLKKDRGFMEPASNGEWYPIFDEVTHWMYMPDPPPPKKELNKRPVFARL